MQKIETLLGEARQNLTLLNNVKSALEIEAVKNFITSLEGIEVNDAFKVEVDNVKVWVDTHKTNVENVLNTAEVFVHCDELETNAVKAFAEGSGAYLEDVSVFADRTYSFEFAGSRAAYFEAIGDFSNAMKTFDVLVDAAMVETETEISQLEAQIAEAEATAKLQAEANAKAEADADSRREQMIQANIAIINDEHAKVEDLFLSCEGNMNLLQSSKSSGAKAYIDNIVKNIKSMNSSTMRAKESLGKLVELEAVEVSELNELVQEMDVRLTEANELKVKADSAAVSATQKEHASDLRKFAKAFDLVNKYKKDAEDAKLYVNNLLVEARQIILEQNLLVPLSLQKIEKSIEMIEENLVELEHICKDALQLNNEVVSDSSKVVAHLKEMETYKTIAESFKTNVSLAKVSAQKALRSIKRIENTPTTFGELFGYVAVVPTKDFRKYTTITKFWRSIFGAAMLVSFLIGAMNWAIAFHDLMHTVAAGLVAGTVWFFVMWTIDRLFVMSMDKQAAKKLSIDTSNWGFKEELNYFFKSGAAISWAIRLTIIYFSSVMVAELMTANIYNKEIQQELIVMKSEKVQSINKIRTAKIAELTAQQDLAQSAVTPFIVKFNEAAKPLVVTIKNQRNLVDELQQDYTDEYNGISRSGRPRGNGSLAKQKKAELDKAESRLNTLETEFEGKKTSLPEYAQLMIEQKKADAEIKRLNSVITEENTRFAGESERMQNASGDGLDNRMTALHRISAKSPWPFVIMVILFLIEATTLIGKMFIGADEHVHNLRSIMEAYEESLRVKDLQRRRKNANLMVGERKALIDLKRDEYADNELVLMEERKHQNNILNSMASPQDLVRISQAIDDKRAYLIDLVARQREINELYEQLEPDSNRKKTRVA